MDRAAWALAITGTLVLAGLIDALILRGLGTNVIHAVFSVLHDPGTTLFNIVLLPAATMALVVSSPGYVVATAWRKHRQVVLSLAIVVSLCVVWVTKSDALIRFYDRTPFPEDVANDNARDKLVQLQSNYWASFLADSKEDMDAAKTDYLKVLANIREAECKTFSQYLALSSERSKWSTLLDLIGAFVFGYAVWLLLLQTLVRKPLDGGFREGLVISTSLWSLQSVLSGYSEWYINFGSLDFSRSRNSIIGMSLATVSLVLSRVPADARLPWVKVSRYIAIFSLAVIAVTLVYPEAFNRAATMLASANLSIVITVYILVAIVVFATVRGFSGVLLR